MNKLIITLIIILASVIRLLNLDTHIAAAYGDEVAIAYNAYSILKTGRDEFSEFMPLQFKSWGDQKNPVYVYTLSLIQIIFGINAFSVRLPSAISGIFAVLLTYLITKQLLARTSDNQNSTLTESVALLAALLLAVNPWHLHISRGGYEANMALTFGLAALYFLLRHDAIKSTTQRFFTLPMTLALIVASLGLYTYYTTKMFLPLFFILFWLWLLISNALYPQIKQSYYLKQGLLSLIILALASLPFAYLAVFSSGQARFTSINIFANPEVASRVIEERGYWQGPEWLERLVINKPVMWARDFTHYLFDNLGSLYWYIFGDNTLRYTIGNHGVFYTIEAPFFLLGLCFLFQRNKKLTLFLVVWLLFAVIPTALVGKSYSLRSLALLPVPMIITAYGVVHSYLYLKNILQRFPYASATTMFHRSTWVFIAFIFVLMTGNFLARYAYAYPTYGYYWYDGAIKDALDYAQSQQSEIDYVVVSDQFGKTELYYAFYKKLDPSHYQIASQQKISFAEKELVQLDNYYFGTVDINKLPTDGKTYLVIAPPNTIGGLQIKAKDDNRALYDVQVVRR